MIYIGIDPGISGGIAALTDQGLVIAVQKMPATIRDVLTVFQFYARRAEVEGPCRAMLERVGVMPGQGNVSGFTFGKGVGHLEMALTAAEIPFDQPTPRTWQAAIGVIYGHKNLSDTAKKNIAKRRAQQLFPREDVTHAIADALLIAEYCRRFHAGIITAKGTHGKKSRQGKARDTAQTGPGVRRREGAGAQRTERQAAFESRAQARAARRGAPGDGGPRHPGAR